jgi:hypothetical protein
MKESKPSKSITLTPEELAEYEKFKPLAHYDPETGKNTFHLYSAALGAWTAKLRKKHKIDDESSFFFR